MSIENVKAFREALNESKELQEKIAAGEDWVEVAKAANFEFTKEELRKVLAVQESEELSETELEGVAGAYTREPIAGEIRRMGPGEPTKIAAEQGM